jgi:hypothetical protein
LGAAFGCSSQNADSSGPNGHLPDDGQTDGGGTGGSNSSDAGADSVTTPGSPFASLESVANARAAFSQPRAGVPLPDGSVAFIATQEGRTAEDVSNSGSLIGVWLVPPSGGEATLLYAGDKLVNPSDIDASRDGKTLYLVDSSSGEDGRGAILTLPVSGGEPTEVVTGGAPRGITVADDDHIYFSGIDPDSGEVGVFLLAGGSVSTVYAGAPFVDPSGIAVRKDGGVLVSDTRLCDSLPEGTSCTVGADAGVVLVKDGQASIFATGFATGYPAGIALTTDEKNLIISGQGPDRSDTVYIVDMANPTAAPTVVTAEFSAFQDSSGGLKRAHDSNTFIWASLSANRGTVYRIRTKS